MTVLRIVEDGHFSAVYGQRICLLFFLNRIRALAVSPAFQSREYRCSQNNVSQYPLTCLKSVRCKVRGNLLFTEILQIDRGTFWQKNVRCLIEGYFRWHIPKRRGDVRCIVRKYPLT